MITATVLLIFSMTFCAAQKHKGTHRAEWDYRNEAEKLHPRGCANLTLVLDNWKYAIMTQVKDLLLHDHSTVLPDYGRIQPLSIALGDLYKEFNALKERLAELTANFERVEAFVDEVRMKKKPTHHLAEAKSLGLPLPPPGSTAVEFGVRSSGRRRSRVVVRRVIKPEV